MGVQVHVGLLARMEPMGKRGPLERLVLKGNLEFRVLRVSPGFRRQWKRRQRRKSKAFMCEVFIKEDGHGWVKSCARRRSESVGFEIGHCNDDEGDSCCC